MSTSKDSGIAHHGARGRGMIAGALGLAICLAAVTGHGGEPLRNERKPSAGDRWRGPGSKPYLSSVMLCMDEEAAAAVAKERLRMLTNEEAWKRLPGAPENVQSLPAWARLLAGPLPLTTARMLELDAMHRTGNRLDPKVRGLARWASADANRCEYAKQFAAADLRRAGMNEARLRALADDPTQLTPPEQAAVAFARKMMRDAAAVTDDEMHQLVQLFGEERVVALVALVAHASFQDRVFLATNVQVEPEGPLTPLAVKFTKPMTKPPVQAAAPDEQPQTTVAGAEGTAVSDEWLALQESLSKQRARSGRIRVPSREQVIERIGQDHPALWQLDILWSRVCYGFQPELTDAWFASSAAYRQEAGLDRVFEQSIFWVATQTLECFY